MQPSNKALQAFLGFADPPNTTGVRCVAKIIPEVLICIRGVRFILPEAAVYHRRQSLLDLSRSCSSASPSAMHKLCTFIAYICTWLGFIWYTRFWIDLVALLILGNNVYKPWDISTQFNCGEMTCWHWKRQEPHTQIHSDHSLVCSPNILRDVKTTPESAIICRYAFVDPIYKERVSCVCWMLRPFWGEFSRLDCNQYHKCCRGINETNKFVFTSAWHFLESVRHDSRNQESFVGILWNFAGQLFACHFIETFVCIFIE